MLDEMSVESRHEVLNAQSEWGYTALHWCAVYNHAEVAKVLLENGCEASIPNSRGKTAWDLADTYQALDVLRLFENSSMFFHCKLPFDHWLPIPGPRVKFSFNLCVIAHL